MNFKVMLLYMHGSYLISKLFTLLCSKVIGARFYHDNPATFPSIESPADEEGHGSHTSSVAAGVSIAGVNL